MTKLTNQWFALGVFAWLGWSHATAWAEPETKAAPLLVKSWRTADGLPQNSVNAIVQTADGYLWVGTNGGLARFDGVRFANYGLADGLKSGRITDLADDGLGGLWIATLGGGLSRWQAGKFTTLTTADGLAHNDVMALARAEPGGVWIGTKRGVQHWGAKGFTKLGNAEGLTAEVVSLAVDHEQGLWVTVEEQGLYYCKDGRCERIEGPPKFRSFHGYSLLVDPAGDLWVSIGNATVLRRRAGEWTELNATDGLPVSFIFRLAQGTAGEIWAGSQEAGLFVFRAGRFQAVPGTEAAIRAVRMGRDGVIWAGTAEGGLSRLTPRKLAFHPVGRADRRGRVNGLVEEPPGHFWVGTYGGGLHHGRLEQLEPWLDLQTLIDRPFLLAGLRMSNGALAFGGIKVLFQMEPGGRNPQAVPLAENITALCEGAGGTLWLGTREGELKQWVHGAARAVANGTFSASITGLVRGPGASLWVATHGAGLFRWDAGQVQRWGVAEGLPTEVIRTLYQDAAGTLWIGTGGGGLAWLEHGRFHAVNTRQGLGDDYISQILEDDAGNLWLGCHRGIFRVSKRELQEVAAGQATAVHPLALDESDGMTTAECTGGYSPAGLRSQSGTLYFSTVRGVVAVDPAQFGAVAAPPEVLIEEVRLNGKTIPFTGPRLSLPPGTRELEIHYSAFNYTKPEQLRFRHRLGGLEGRWTEADGPRSVRYARLPPGDYRFLVSAANQDGHWNEAGATLLLTVQPFFWQTAWFRTALVLSLMASVGGAVWVWARARIRRAHERERLARAEAEAQQHLNRLTHLTRVSTLGELATTLAHELNQPLAAIHSNAEAAEIFLQKDAPDLPELRAIFGDIRADGDRARQVIHRMRAMLQRHPFQTERIEISGLFKALDGLLHGVILSRQARLRFDVAPALPPVQGDAVHLQQVLLNLILNALDAMSDGPAADREVVVRATARDPRWVEVSVTDRGPGFPAEKLAKLSEPFFTTKKEGMGMGLAICHSIAQTHGGRLVAENLSAGGAVVRLSLPASAKAE